MKLGKTSSNNKDLKIFNRKSVLNVIRHKGPIARTEVAQCTGLTPSAVTVIVNDLMKKGVVREVGRGESSGGRRPVYLELDSRAAYIFTVRIGQGEINTALMDLAGNQLESTGQKSDTTRPEEVGALIGANFLRITTGAGIKPAQVFRCGVASPGLVNSYEGVVERSSNLDWSKVPLSSILSPHLGGIPVHVENICNAAALGEKFYGSGVGCANLVYLNLSYGIGAGIIIGHELFGGAQGYAGEVGSAVYPVLNGPRGDRPALAKTLKELCGVRAILERVKTEVADEVFGKYELSKNRLGIEEVLRLPLIEVPEVQAVIDDAAYLVGLKVAELIGLFNTEMVVLGGELTLAGNLLLDRVKQTVAANSLPEMSSGIKIINSSMRQDPPLMGVYRLVLEQLFQSEVWV